jgi:SH3-like domain-containing protein
MRLGFAAAAALCLFSLNAAAAGPESEAGAHFVSLRTESANGRRGPGLEHRIDWIYERPGLPLLVIGESGPWRRVRDPDGAEVWMHAQNLGPRRMAYVRAAAELRRQPRANAGVKAHLAPGVIGALTGCEAGWLRIAVGGRVGWVEAPAVWGAEGCAGL